MKYITNKLLILLSAIMLTTTTSFSANISEKDSMITITPIQLKRTNLIFAEHSKLLIENKLLRKQINNYEEDNNLLLITDSVRISQINGYQELNKSLNESLKKKNKNLLYWKIGGITVSSSLLLLFILK